MNKKKNLLNNGLLWFGASISIAEILTGGLIAPLGFKKGILAIILGHVIGCTLLYFAGLIGTKSGLSSMESSRMSFGKYGSYVFSSLNILQLVGWTAIMIIGGANVLNAVSYTLFGFANKALWCMLISILIIIWILIGFENLGRLNVIAVGGLFILTIVLGIVIFKGANFKLSTISDNILSFGMAVELSVAMPLSWLPLIADYTRNNQNNKLITPISVFSYFLGSVWMYIIGLWIIGFIVYRTFMQINIIVGNTLPVMIIISFICLILNLIKKQLHRFSIK